MNKVIALLMVVMLFGSCGIQKRHYLKGFYVPGNKTQEITLFSEKKKKSPPHVERTPPRLMLVGEQEQAQAIAIPQISTKKAPVLFTKKTAINRSLQKNLSCPVKIPVFSRRDILPDDVPRAGFRLMLYGLLFLALAVGLFMLYPELVYFAVSLLIISLIFAIVSIISSVNARKDKVSNSPDGLRIAHVSIIIDILITAGIVVFLILLF